MLYFERVKQNTTDNVITSTALAPPSAPATATTIIKTIDDQQCTACIRIHKHYTFITEIPAIAYSRFTDISAFLSRQRRRQRTTGTLMMAVVVVAIILMMVMVVVTFLLHCVHSVCSLPLGLFFFCFYFMFCEFHIRIITSQTCSIYLLFMSFTSYFIVSRKERRKQRKTNTKTHNAAPETNVYSRGFAINKNVRDTPRVS